MAATDLLLVPSAPPSTPPQPPSPQPNDISNSPKAKQPACHSQPRTNSSSTSPFSSSRLSHRGKRLAESLGTEALSTARYTRHRRSRREAQQWFGNHVGALAKRSFIWMHGVCAAVVGMIGGLRSMRICLLGMVVGLYVGLRMFLAGDHLVRIYRKVRCRAVLLD